MLRVICCLSGVALVLALTSTVQAVDRPEIERPEIERRYHEAIETSLTSDSADHEALMRSIVADAPDYGPARAELGEVRVDGRWLPVGYAQHLASEDPRLESYRELRERSNAEQDSLRLARWCEKQGLDYEARAHWLNVLQERPKHPEALKRLNAGWRDGALWDLTLAAQASERSEEMQRSAKAWEKRFRQFESRRTVPREELTAIGAEIDVGAIEPVERRLAVLMDNPDPPRAERASMLLDAWFDAVDRLDDVEVTASLCRTAIYANPPESGRAIEALRDRPQIDTMPMLLSSLIAPIESTHRITRDRLGNVTYEHQLLRESAERRDQHNRFRSADVRVRTINPRGQNFGSYTTQEAYTLALIQARFEGVRNQIAYQQEANQSNRTAAMHNAVAEEVNSRVINVLSDLTGRQLGDEPSVWWDHWRELTGYEVYDRPTEQTYDVTYKIEDVVADPTLYYIPPPPPPPPGQRCECFVAGTPVWTRTGKRAIEDLRPGDLVLARDPHVGGLVYRAVTDTTVREPSPTVRLTAGDETIIATVGHPFWVVGAGWTMAKDLAAGEVLSTVDGPLELDHAENHADRTAHNLVVEGAANYYVGRAGVLVHDNTPRQPAVGLTASR